MSTHFSPQRHRICLVSTSHPASNPRLVKEATALANAGYDVRVVAARTFPPLDASDADILRSAPGRWVMTDFTRGVSAIVAKVQRRIWRSALRRGVRVNPTRATRAWNAASLPLARVAAYERADLYIGHTLGGLAAAGIAAERVRSQIGFDAEDFHSGETHAAETDVLHAQLVRSLESHWLPRCVHLTAASPLIADAYAATYAIRRPVSVLNVFPLSEQPAEFVPPGVDAPRLYWFSQTLGADRGLEALIDTLGRMKRRVSLHLRGQPVPGQPERLRLLAKQCGFNGEIEFLPRDLPSRMASLAAHYDLGMSLEHAPPRNKDLCLGNKIFTYLLAGIPVVLTPTLAQQQLAHDLKEAALLIDFSDPTAAAATLDSFFADRTRQEQARATARRLAVEHYNWDLEQQHLLAAVRHVLNQNRVSLNT